MKRNRHIILFTLLIMTFAAFAQARNTVKVRLVEAYNASGKGTVSEGLEDVARMLKKNLNYNSLSLLGNTTVSLPSGSPVSIGGYQLSIKGAGNNLNVSVDQAKKTIFRSKVKLNPRSPVIFGGFKGSRGKVMFIFNLQD